MGQIIPSTSMPSSKISFPVNGGTFPADTAFNFTMNVENMNLGNFVNAAKVRSVFGSFLLQTSHPGLSELLWCSPASSKRHRYGGTLCKSFYGTPTSHRSCLQHSHVTVQSIPAIDTTEIPNSQDFVFFKGLNDKDVNGVLSTELAKGLPAGAYRFCSV